MSWWSHPQGTPSPPRHLPFFRRTRKLTYAVRRTGDGPLTTPQLCGRLQHANSAFNAFSDFFLALDNQHVLQGVDFHVKTAGVTLRGSAPPAPKRMGKIQQAIRTALQEDELSPQTAGRLAGKLSFLTQAVFEAVGKSAMQPLYARPHDTSSQDTDKLSSALKALNTMLNHLLPAPSSPT